MDSFPFTLEFDDLKLMHEQAAQQADVSACEFGRRL